MRLFLSGMGMILLGTLWIATNVWGQSTTSTLNGATGTAAPATAAAGSVSPASYSFDSTGYPTFAPTKVVCDPSFANPSRTDGVCNNVAMPFWGVRQTPFLRLLDPATYREFDPNQKPNERVVSNVVHSIAPDEDGLKDERNIGDWTYQFGQFINHDMHDSNNPGPNPISAPIPVPYDDTLKKPIFFNRIAKAPKDQKGVQLSLNGEATHFLDASTVYGSAQEVTNELRAFKDGLLRSQLLSTAEGIEEFPPFQRADFIIMDNPNRRDPTTLFIAGDKRANEQPNLLTIHILFMRNHNWWAKRLKATYPNWNDEQLFQEARKLNRAEIQKISFFDLLRVYVGKNLFSRLGPYPGYNPRINPAGNDAMVCSGMRIGHSQVGLLLETNVFIPKEKDFRYPISSIAGAANGPGSGGSGGSSGDAPQYQQRCQFNQKHPGLVSDAFFTPEFVSNSGIDTWLLGATRSSSSKVDQSATEPLRNLLFPGHSNDLIAIDDRRCRDMGIRSWTAARASLGLPVPKDFTELGAFVLTVEDVQHLQRVYRTVNDIDLFTGSVVERHAEGASMGSLNGALWLERFQRARIADRFWFENPGVFSAADSRVDNALRALVFQTTLKTVILRNTKLLPAALNQGTDDLFFGPFPVGADDNCDQTGAQTANANGSGGSTTATTGNGNGSGNGGTGGGTGGGGANANSGPGNGGGAAGVPKPPEVPEAPAAEAPVAPDVPEAPAAPEVAANPLGSSALTLDTSFIDPPLQPLSSK